MKRIVNFLFLILVLGIAFSCSVERKYTVSDRALNKILVKEKWITNIVPYGRIHDLQNSKAVGNSVDFYFYYWFEFRKDGTLTFRFKSNRVENDFDSIGPIKFENARWKLLDKKFYLKAEITYRDYLSSDSTFYEYSDIVDNVSTFFVRNKKSRDDFQINFTRIDEDSKSYSSSPSRKIRKVPPPTPGSR
jgi:hypothetical protein